MTFLSIVSDDIKSDFRENSKLKAIRDIFNIIIYNDIKYPLSFNREYIESTLLKDYYIKYDRESIIDVLLVIFNDIIIDLFYNAPIKESSFFDIGLIFKKDESFDKVKIYARNSNVLINYSNDNSLILDKSITHVIRSNKLVIYLNNANVSIYLPRLRYDSFDIEAESSRIDLKELNSSKFNLINQKSIFYIEYNLLDNDNESYINNLSGNINIRLKNVKEVEFKKIKPYYFSNDLLSNDGSKLSINMDNRSGDIIFS